MFPLPPSDTKICRGTLWVSDNFWNWHPVKHHGRLMEIIRHFTYSTLLFSHGSYSGQASLTLGKICRGTLWVSDNFWNWHPVKHHGRLMEIIRHFTYSTLLFSHGSYSGQASLTLGKDTRKYNIPVVMASVYSFKQTRQYFCFPFLETRPSLLPDSRQQPTVAPASGFSPEGMKKKKKQ